MHWSTLIKLIGVDSTFSVLFTQVKPLAFLSLSYYHSGRIYDPSVIQNTTATLTIGICELLHPYSQAALNDQHGHRQRPGQPCAPFRPLSLWAHSNILK